MTVPVALLRVCADLGRELTPAHAQQLAAALGDYGSRDGAEPVVATVPTAHFQSTAKKLLAAWSVHPNTSGQELGAAIAASAHAHQLARTEPHIELVMSGPSSAQVHARMTDQVLLDVIASAKQRLLLVTFSLYMYPELKKALTESIASGVAVTVLAEDPKDRDMFTKEPAVALAGLPVTRLRWPRGMRPAAGITSLHAKIAVADDHTAFITSANLSEKASGDNIEAGLLIRGGDCAERISDHVATLFANGILISS